MKTRRMLVPAQVRNLKRYGLTLQSYEAMCLAQNNACGICAIVSGKLVVDHDHVTGVVRKLLCRSCNAMIGMGMEDPSILIRGAEYVRIYKPTRIQ